MKLLISRSYILPISEEDFLNTISMFDKVYVQTEIQVMQSFSEWMTSFIIQQNRDLLERHDTDGIIKVLDRIFTDPGDTKRLSLLLFPYQFDFTFNNWEYIKDILSMYEYFKKGTEEITFTSFAESSKYFNNNIGTVIHI